MCYMLLCLVFCLVCCSHLLLHVQRSLTCHSLEGYKYRRAHCRPRVEALQSLPGKTRWHSGCSSWLAQQDGEGWLQRKLHCISKGRWDKQHAGQARMRNLTLVPEPGFSVGSQRGKHLDELCLHRVVIPMLRILEKGLELEECLVHQLRFTIKQHADQ